MFLNWGGKTKKGFLKADNDNDLLFLNYRDIINEKAEGVALSIEARKSFWYFTGK